MSSTAVIQETIPTGDTVKHLPSGEEWLVAFVEGEHLSWCGWPEGFAKLSDCVLVEKASDEKRKSLLDDLAKMDGADTRKRYAQRELSKKEAAAQ